MKNLRILTLLSLCCAVLILACSDTPTDPEDELTTYLFSLTVVDDSDQAVDGLWIRSSNQYTDLRRTGPRLALPATQIGFSLPSGSTVSLTIQNYYGEIVETILDSERLEAAVYSVEWDNSSFISGYYRYHLLAIPDQGDTLEVFKWMILEQSQGRPHTIGGTDANGQMFTNDTLLFPCLLGDPPTIVRTGPGGDTLGIITDFYHDRVTIMITDTTVGGGSMLIDTSLIVGQNNFRVTLIPVDL